jgi:hypothetical protein
MNDQKQQIVDKLQGANNILVTVSSNPSVDQLAACIGLTLLLNKLKKHATAVFSGQIPSTIEFLQPETTLEKNTDSLRDFIISLDKSKADKLRYKVEENVVKIFITPYRTSINQDDLEFSQGDFNVDVVVALGVHEQADLDQAITAHGRILHDAVVAGINTSPSSELGSINWTNPAASSLSELVTDLADSLGKELVDEQIATALMTGIVAETGRFSNEKTSPDTMRLSAELMAAGANQQLVATKLQEDLLPSGAAAPPVRGTDNGTLEITHPRGTGADIPAEAAAPSVPEESEQPAPAAEPEPIEPPSVVGTPKIMTTPPSLGGTLTANSNPEEEMEPTTDPLSLPEVEAPMLSHDQPEPQHLVIQPPAPEEPMPAAPAPDPSVPTPPPAEPKVPASSVAPETLTDIEQAVQSPHVAADDRPAAPEPKQPGQIHIDEQGNLISPNEPAASAEPAEQTPDVDTARSAVLDAINSTPPEDQPLEPTAASGASGYLTVNLPEATTPPVEPPVVSATPPSVPDDVPAPAFDAGNEPAPGLGPADKPMDMPLPPNLTPPPANPLPPSDSASDTPSGPPAPPVPPPMTPPGFLNPNQG